ncbi:nucleotidyl transferase AbiEii/AbiGii toxin family protein, partial [Burkholderia pseudomallei]
THFKDLVEFDRCEFRLHESFVTDPAKCMKSALGEIEHVAQTISEYADMVIPGIYGKDRPTVFAAGGGFEVVGVNLL